MKENKAVQLKQRYLDTRLVLATVINGKIKTNDMQVRKTAISKV